MTDGGFQLTSKQEIINIQIGRSGNAIAHEFWRDLCEEHDIHWEQEGTRGEYHPDDDFDDHLDVFFNEGQKKGRKTRWVPRSILMDLNMSDLATITQDPLGDLYRPENIIGNDEGSGNCYAKAFHTDGPDLADTCLETVRKEVERCNCLQGIQFVHSVSGGTGSGLTGLLMRVLEDYLGKDGKVIMQNFALVPSPGQSDMLVEPYNAALSLADIIEHSHQCFVFDNAALTGICQKALQQDMPRMKSLNNVVALCMSGLTSGLRFTGDLNADLRKLHVNLVPYSRCKFLISSLAPLGHEDSRKYRPLCARDLAQQVMSKENITCKVDPQSPALPGGPPGSRFLASWASWRGKWQTHEVDTITHDIWKKTSRLDMFFPDWIPNPIATNICAAPHCDIGDSLVFVSNNTAVASIFKRVKESWDLMFQRKAYTHLFLQEGIDEGEMLASAENMTDLAGEYDHYAGLPDTIDAGAIDDEIKELERPMYLES